MLLWISAIFLGVAVLWWMSRKQIKGSPPIVYGNIPFIGTMFDVLMGKHEYLAKQRQIHGDTFKLYILGGYATVLFDENDVKLMMKSKDAALGQFYTELFWDWYPTISPWPKEVDQVALIHTFTSPKENTTHFLKVQQKEAIEMYKGWAKKGKVDLFAEMSYFVCKINLSQFIGHAPEHFVKNFLETETASVIKRSALKNWICRKLGVTSPLDVVYEKLVVEFEGWCKERKEHPSEDRIPLDDLLSNEIVEGSLSHRHLIDFLWQLIFAAQLNTQLMAFWILHALYTATKEEIGPVLDEIDNMPEELTVDRIQNEMPMCDKLIYEIFRLCYMGFPCGRILLNDIKFSSCTLPKGSRVLQAYISNGSYYHNNIESPKRIDLSMQEKSAQPTSFTPFGCGAHPCTGRIVAMNEVKTFLIVARRTFDAKSLNQSMKMDDAPDWMRPADGQAMFEIKLKQ